MKAKASLLATAAAPLKSVSKGVADAGLVSALQALTPPTRSARDNYQRMALGAAWLAPARMV